jgi:uncharacterized protein
MKPAGGTDVLVPHMTAQPPQSAHSTPSTERIGALDVVRGVSVAGILFANVLVFFGLFVIPEAREAALPTAGADRIASFLERVLVEGKFYSIFSLLFGIGFGLQLARGGDASLPRFRRRLKILLAIGAIHAVLIWAGDILMLYALLGFTMPWFARKSDWELLRWTIILLALPTALYVLGLLLWFMFAGGPSPEAAEGMPPRILAIFESVGTGGLKEAFLGNSLLLVGRWMDLIATIRFPKVLGMFLLGLWTVRSGLALSLPTHRKTLVRWSLFGWMVGLPANLVAAWALDRWEYLPPSGGAFIGVLAQGIGIPILALGYAATVALLVLDRRRLMAPFAPMGRMALTNYLMQSIICVILSYGIGLGLWWRIGASRAMAIAAAIVLVQIPISALWLARYRFGPVEWIWRRLTYGRPL